MQLATRFARHTAGMLYGLRLLQLPFHSASRTLLLCAVFIGLAMGRCAFTGDMLLKTWTYEAHGGEVVFVSETSGVLCKWHYCCAVFIGLAMGLCAFLVDVLLETLNNWKFGAVNSVIRTRGGFWAPYLAYQGFCLLYSGHYCTFIQIKLTTAKPHNLTCHGITFFPDF